MSMLKSKEMLKRFWGEVASTIVYILNRCPTKKIFEKTPYGSWTGLKPNVSYLRVFGSMCFRNVPEKLRKKLDDRSQRMVLIGYHLIGAYKLYSINDDKLMISRYVLVTKVKGGTELRIQFDMNKMQSQLYLKKNINIMRPQQLKKENYLSKML